MGRAEVSNFLLGQSILQSWKGLSKRKWSWVLPLFFPREEEEEQRVACLQAGEKGRDQSPRELGKEQLCCAHQSRSSDLPSLY